MTAYIRKEETETMQEPEDGKSAVEQCPLEMTWPLQPRTHRRYG